MRRSAKSLALLALTVALLGCGREVPASPVQDSPPVPSPEFTAAAQESMPVAPPTNAAPSAAPSPETLPLPPTDEPPREGPPDTLALGRLRGLAPLDSYRLSAHVIWSPADGDPRAVTLRTEALALEYASGVYRDHVRRWTLTTALGGSDVDTIEFITFGDRTWQREGDRFQEAAVPPYALIEQMGWIAAPWEMLRPSAEGRLIGTDIAQGKEIWGYAFDQTAFVDEQDLGYTLSAGEAEAWVTPEHEIVVRFSVQAQGTDEADRPGTLTVEATVTDINIPMLVELPEGLRDD